MIGVDSVVSHFLKKATRDPIKIKLLGYPYELYIYTREIPPSEMDKDEQKHREEIKRRRKDL